MICDKTIAIIMSNLSERRTLGNLLLDEGFLVNAYGSTGEFVCSVNLAECGCLIVDSDLPRVSPWKPGAVDFAQRWSQQLPVILLTSESSARRQDLPVPGVSKSANENELLYAVYGAMGKFSMSIS